MNKHYVSLTALVAALAACAGPAFAGGTVLAPFEITGLGNYNSVNLSADGGNSYTGELSGRYSGSVNGQATNIWCVDLTHNIGVPGGYTANIGYGVGDTAGALDGSYYDGGLASAINSGDLFNVTGTGLSSQSRANSVAFLVQNYNDATAATFASGASGSQDLNANLTALSLSIWDLIVDGGNGISAGTVQGDSSAQSTYGAMVNYYESQAIAHDNQQYLNVRWIQAPVSNGDHLQDFAYLAPVPEASTVVLFAALLIGGIVTLRIQRKQRSIA